MGRDIPARYKAVERNGKILYCQTAAVVDGTRLPQERCLTRRRSESIRPHVDRIKPCTAMSAFGG